MANNLEKSILSTIVYFDIFDYPLTLAEIWRWLWRDKDFFEKSDLSEISKVLENSEFIKSHVESRRGFYFLRGRDEILESRRKRYNFAREKFGKIFRLVGFLKLLPGIKMIAVCNSVAWNNSREESDIDLFIVTKSKKVWTARFWAAGFLKLFNLRPDKKTTKNRICLSFFIDEENFNLERISINQPDIYLVYWISQIVPIFDPEKIYEKFLGKNRWVKKYLPNFIEGESDQEDCCVESPSWKLKKNIFSKFGLENFFRKLQMMVLPASLKEMANRGTQVVIDGGMLKFHENDRREFFKKKWEEKFSELVNKNL